MEDEIKDVIKDVIEFEVNKGIIARDAILNYGKIQTIWKTPKELTKIIGSLYKHYLSSSDESIDKNIIKNKIPLIETYLPLYYTLYKIVRSENMTMDTWGGYVRCGDIIYGVHIDNVINLHIPPSFREEERIMEHLKQKYEELKAKNISEEDLERPCCQCELECELKEGKEEGSEGSKEKGEQKKELKLNLIDISIRKLFFDILKDERMGIIEDGKFKFDRLKLLEFISKDYFGWLKDNKDRLKEYIKENIENAFKNIDVDDLFDNSYEGLIVDLVTVCVNSCVTYNVLSKVFREIIDIMKDNNNFEVIIDAFRTELPIHILAQLKRGYSFKEVDKKISEIINEKCRDAIKIDAMEKLIEKLPKPNNVKDSFRYIGNIDLEDFYKFRCNNNNLMIKNIPRIRLGLYVMKKEQDESINEIKNRIRERIRTTISEKFDDYILVGLLRKGFLWSLALFGDDKDVKMCSDKALFELLILKKFFNKLKDESKKFNNEKIDFLSSNIFEKIHRIVIFDDVIRTGMKILSTLTKLGILSEFADHELEVGVLTIRSVNGGEEILKKIEKLEFEKIKIKWVDTIIEKDKELERLLKNVERDLEKDLNFLFDFNSFFGRVTKVINYMIFDNLDKKEM